jgi:hypothetical protein
VPRTRKKRRIRTLSARKRIESLPHDPSLRNESNLLNGIASERGVTTVLSAEPGARLHFGL